MYSQDITCWKCKQVHHIVCSSDGYDKWQEGMLIQDALPELSSGEREMLISGTCDPCFDKMFGDTEDVEEDEEDEDNYSKIIGVLNQAAYDEINLGSEAGRIFLTEKIMEVLDLP